MVANAAVEEAAINYNYLTINFSR